MKPFLSKYLSRYSQVALHYVFGRQITAMPIKGGCVNSGDIACPYPPKCGPRQKWLPNL